MTVSVFRICKVRNVEYIPVYTPGMLLSRFSEFLITVSFLSYFLVTSVYIRTDIYIKKDM
jgi:hypothetical protein